MLSAYRRQRPGNEHPRLQRNTQPLELLALLSVNPPLFVWMTLVEVPVLEEALELCLSAAPVEGNRLRSELPKATREAAPTTPIKDKKARRLVGWVAGLRTGAAKSLLPVETSQRSCSQIFNTTMPNVPRDEAM